MRSPVLSVFFLTLFALLFGAVCAAPIGSPNVSSKRSCILGRCENAGSTQPDNALFKFLDVRSAVLHFKASLVRSEPPTLTTTPSPSPSSSASSSASMAAPTGVPQPSPTPIKWFTEIAIPASDVSGSEA
ncbi:hypothetical protein EDB84DRAFT_1568989 [Lactarius hengduanensis]|nr:hypothetical protein EDB84DRAFT_1568989 [Lactarius hengduanensis]